MPTLNCPRCRTPTEIGAEMANRAVTCPACGVQFAATLEDPRASPEPILTAEVVDTSADVGPAASPWLTIWIRPRPTIRRIVDTDPTRGVVLLAMLAGVDRLLDRMSLRNAGDQMDFPAILLTAAVAGPIAGIVGVWLSALLLRWTGHWIEGAGSLTAIRAAVAWAGVPVTASLAVWVLDLTLIGREMFTSDTPRLDATPFLALTVIASGVMQFVLALWSIWLFVVCLAEVQRFSAWKAIGNALLAGLVIFIPLLALVLAVFAIRA
jgi:hypothetical protein